MNKANRLLSLFLASLMIISCCVFSLTAFAENDTSIGVGLTWEYQKNQKKLLISGTGDIKDFETTSPWIDYTDPIEIIVIAEGVKSIGSNAFAELKSVESIQIPTTVQAIKTSAFRGCTSLQKFKVASGNKYFVTDTYGVLFNIDKTAVYKCPSKMSSTLYTIPNTVYAIADYAFDNSNLNKITFSNNISYIGTHAFENCSLKDTVTLPTALATIDDWAFANCTGIKSIKTSSQLDFIGDFAFYNCSDIGSFYFYSSITSTGDQAFTGCSALTDVYFTGSKEDWEALNTGIPVPPVEIHFYTGYIIRYKTLLNDVKNMPTNQIETALNVHISSVEPKLEGYTFVGWSTDSKATKAEYKPGDLYSEQKSITLFTVFDKTDYKIVFDANGGTGAPASQTFTCETRYQIPATIPSKGTFEFIGWSTDKDATVAAYKPSDYINVDRLTILYAIWQDNGPYNVMYDANKGTGAPATQLKNKDVTLILSNQTPVREPAERYKFLGWSTSAYSSTISYKPGDEYKENKAITLYAVWEDNGPYTVKFNANGGTNAPAEITKEKNVAAAIPNESPVYAGYTFEGWIYNSITYKPGDKFEINSDATLIALWKKINLSASTTLSTEEKITVSVKPADAIHITATAENMPDNYTLAIYDSKTNALLKKVEPVNGTASIEYDETVTESKSYIIAVIDGNGLTAKDSSSRFLKSSIEINVKQPTSISFINNLILLFRKLFGLTKTTVIK